MTTNPTAPVRRSLFQAPTRGGQRSEVFPIKVESYDTSSANPREHTVTGTRLDNHEIVTVSLRDIEKKKGSAFERPSLLNLSSKREFRNDPGTEIGGVLLIEDAQKVAEGVYTSRWMRSLSHNAEEAEVMIVTAHVTPVRYTKSKDPKPFASIVFLHDGNMSHLSQDMIDGLNLMMPGKVEDASHLRDCLIEVLSTGASAGVRVSNAEAFDGLYLSPKDGVAVETLVDDFITKSVPAEVLESINNGSMTCELIPYSSVWAGPKTVDAMVKNVTVRNRLERYRDQEEVETQGGGRKVYDVNLFRPTVVAMRLTKPGEDGKRGLYFTHFEPLNTRQPVVGMRNAIAYASTEDFAPVPEAPTHLMSYARRNAAQNNAGGNFDAEGAAFDGRGPAPLPEGEDMSYGGFSEAEMMSHGPADDFTSTPAPQERPARRPRPS